MGDTYEYNMGNDDRVSRRSVVRSVALSSRNLPSNENAIFYAAFDVFPVFGGVFGLVTFSWRISSSHA